MIELYVLGLASDEERAEVESMALRYPELNQHIESMQQAMEDYAKAYAMPPREGLKGDMMQRINEVEGTASQPVQKTATTKPPKGIPAWIAGLAALFIIGLGLYALNLKSQNQQQEQQITSLNNEMTILKEDCANTKSSQQQMLALLKDVNTKHVHLLGTNNSPEAVVVAYWNEKEQKAFINVVSMPACPKGHDYQLWADIDGEMVSMGVVDLGQANLISVPYMAKAESLNITLEEGGGSDHPNVARLYVSGKV